MDQDGGGKRTAVKVEIGRPGDDVDVRDEGAVVDDTQALNLKEEENGGVIRGNGEVLDGA